MRDDCMKLHSAKRLMQENDPHSDSSGRRALESSRLYCSIPSKSLGITAYHGFTDSVPDSMRSSL